MPFFDFHLHPTLKSLFSEDKPTEGKVKLSPWTKIDTRKVPFLINWCSELSYILQSQSNLAQLAYNECNLICIALFIPEKDFMDNNLVKGNVGDLAIYLQKDKVDKIINGNPYEILRKEDLLTLTDVGQFGISKHKIVPLKDKAEYVEDDADNIYAVFSVEGCHTLSSSLDKFEVAEIIQNLDSLRQEVAILSLNLTHLSQSPICNQAYGIQFIDKASFKPIGRGLSADGAKIAEHCYQNKIMIDVKHMSLGARQQFYTLRNAPSFTTINQPIVCTHAGFTGISWKEIADYTAEIRDAGASIRLKLGKPIKYGGNYARPSFNASSINLFDEDIIEILTSGGMIGLSLDKRILGFMAFENYSNSRDEFPCEIEYISQKEKAVFFPQKQRQLVIGKAFGQGDCMAWDEINEGGVVNPALEDYHLKHFMAHILHLIVVARNNGYDAQKALKQVCIGSDFDGMINPVHICDTVDELVYFKNCFEQGFELFAEKSEVALPTDFNIQVFSNQLFFENGKNFVFERLDILNDGI